MKILLVEDNDEKANRVQNGLMEDVAEVILEIEVADDATSAKKLLRSNYYDLVILDIALPLRKGEEANIHGGIRLFQEVLSRDIYKRPGHVIGLTARTDIFESSSDTFAAELWSLVFFDNASDGWLECITTKIRHISAAEKARASCASPNIVDVAFIVAVNDELEQVKQNGWEWKQHDVRGDPTLFFMAEYVKKNGSTGRAIAAKAPIMGMSAASILTMKLGFHFQPKLIVMPGICAGDSGEVNLGDLIAGSPIWDYGSGKHKGDANSDLFEPAPYQHTLSSALRGAIERLGEDQDFLEKIWKNFPASKPAGRPTVHIGPFASGAAVVANKALFSGIQEQQHRKLLGLDMEAYGVMSAARELPFPQPDTFVLKGVSDFADTDKGDKLRHYSAYISARVVSAICERID